VYMKKMIPAVAWFFFFVFFFFVFFVFALHLKLL